MLSARSDAEFCRNEAARLAAMRRRRASCRCLSGRSRDFSLVITLFCRAVFFGTGAGGCKGKAGITNGSCTKLSEPCTKNTHHRAHLSTPSHPITAVGLWRYGDAHLLLRTVYEPPVVVLDLLQLVKLHGDVVDGELQQVPEASQVLGGGPRHGTGVLGDMRGRILRL